jgi:predicted helicase
MPTDHRATLAKIKRFDELIRYLRDEMGWPIARDSFEDVDDLFYDFTADELGIDPKTAVKIESIKRMRPLSANQPWGIFFVKFEPKRLPVVALRRILSQVVLKKRTRAQAAEQAAWAADDLLFVSNYGEGDKRQISFAHFAQAEDKRDLPTLKVLGWDNLDTLLHLDAIAETLTRDLAWPEDERDAAAWRKRWRSAFTLRHHEIITTSRDLSIRLAELARAIRDRIKTALAIETVRGPLTKLMKAFQEALVHDLDADGFADMYAQTIAYGLLSARIANPHSKTADDFAAHMRTNPFLRELMQTFLHVGGRRGKAGGPGIDFDELGVSEVVELLDDANMEAVVRDFGDKNPQEDPVIHFYEHFLAAYDKKQKVQRGVFYTPRPVVSYIVRSVDELLRTEFGLADGLADATTWGEMAKHHRDLRIPEGTSPDQPFVQILDPAVGTGTFLVEATDLIHRSLVAKWKAQGHGEQSITALWNEYVPKHLLPRLHGYELLMAPYAIAHLKIELKLYETGYRFGSDVRARIYLTNALEPASDKQLTLALLPALARESQAVNEVKRKQRFTVVIGNPPYSIVSANSGQWIIDLCETYKTTVRTRERQIQALSDDYVKFVRLAQWQVERSGSGLLGLITNNGYLNGHLFVDLRAALRGVCPLIDVLNLHGNVRTRERTPDGSPDENVFDIQTGVAVTFAVKPPSVAGPIVQYADLWGKRLEKYAILTNQEFRTTPYQLLELADFSAPWIPMGTNVRDEWNEMVPLLDVFGTGDHRRDAQSRYAAGFVSQQDDFAIAFSKEEIRARVKLLLKPSTTEKGLRQQFRLCTTTQWNFSRAREELRADYTDALVTRCSYRPFDFRYTVFHRGIVSILRKELMRHLFRRENIALLATRGISRQTFAHVFAATGPVDRHALDNASESMFVFPLFIYPDSVVSSSSAKPLFQQEERVANLASGFRTVLARAVGSADSPGPENTFRYIYAVLHSPSYRSRYAEHLSVDFPRVPLPSSRDLFRDLVRLGDELITLHLLESSTLDHFITTYNGPNNPEVVRVGWSDETVSLNDTATGQPAKSGTIGFRGVPEAVWNFHIGGYKVCEKWLKDRKGRTLSKNDIAHYQKIIVALAQTIRIMKEIDEVIEQHGGWPGACQTRAEKQAKGQKALSP